MEVKVLTISEERLEDLLEMLRVPVCKPGDVVIDTWEMKKEPPIFRSNHESQCL